MQCQKKSIASRSENSETFIKQCANANDWQSKRKLLERNLTKNVMPILVFKVNATRKFWLVSRRMCHQQFTPNIAVSMLLKLHDSRSVRWELHSARLSRFSPHRKRNASGTLLLSGTVVVQSTSYKSFSQLVSAWTVESASLYINQP